MSRKNFRHILFGLSIAAVAIGLSELPASAGTENAAIASSKVTNSNAASSSALGIEPIEVSASASTAASASPVGDRVATSTTLPELAQLPGLAQPSAPEASQSALLTQRMLLAQTTPQTAPQTTPQSTPLPQTPSSPTNPNPSAPPPIEPGAPTPSPSAPPLTEPITPEPSPAPSTPGTDRTPPGTFNPDTNNVSPGRATRSGSSYIGIGGNIGLGSGNTALGEGSFSVFSKVGLTSNVSVRPNVLVSDDPTILLPLTLDFTPRITGASESLSADIGRRISPFIGAGIAISTGNDGAVDFLGTAGVDVPISRQFTATASVNATLFDNPAVGLLLGIGYNF